MTPFAENILSLIPQKPPFVMVDQLLVCDQDVTTTSFTVTASNVLVVNGQFTEAGLMENIAQTAAAGAGYRAMDAGKPVSAGFIGSVKDMEVFALPKIDDELITEVKIENQVLNITVISGAVRCKGALMAQCTMNIFINE